jgi:two-component system NarL family response regulator
MQSAAECLAPEGKAHEAPIRILIADDHPVVCLGLLGIINGQPDMTVVGQARSGTQAVNLARKHSPDIILMDLRMPDMVEAIEAIRAERLESAVIVLTTYQGDEDIRKAIAAGAQSYLVKGTSYLKLLHAIRTVYVGNQYFPRSRNYGWASARVLRRSPSLISTKRRGKYHEE